MRLRCKYTLLNFPTSKRRLFDLTEKFVAQPFVDLQADGSYIMAHTALVIALVLLSTQHAGAMSLSSLFRPLAPITTTRDVLHNLKITLEGGAGTLQVPNGMDDAPCHDGKNGREMLARDNMTPAQVPAHKHFQLVSEDPSTRKTPGLELSSLPSFEDSVDALFSDVSQVRIRVKFSMKTERLRC